MDRILKGLIPEDLRSTHPLPLLSPGVQPPCGEPRSDCGGGDGRAPCAGEGRDGEIPAEQGARQQSKEGEGEVACTQLLPRQAGALGGGQARQPEPWAASSPGRTN